MIIASTAGDFFERWFAGLFAIPWWLWLLAALFAGRSFALRFRGGSHVIRGARLTSLSEAASVVAAQVKGKELSRVAAWGGLEIPFSWMAPHYVFIGATGSGKTMSMAMLCRSALVTDRTLRHRALFFDPKGGDACASLTAMGVRDDEVHWLFPFDQRGSSWHIARDITSFDRARQVASLLVPAAEGTTNPFFENAPLDLAACALWSLHKGQGEDWTLLDFLEVFADKKSIERALSATEEGKRAFRAHIGEADPKTVGNILSTLRTKLMMYRAVASAWERSKGQRSFSVRDWLHGGKPSVLVLSTSEKYSELLSALNRAVFRCASEEVLDRAAERPTDETWIVLDETRAAGKFDGLQSLLEKGRSKGAHVVLGVLDVEGFESAYETGVGRSLLSQCGNVAFFRLESPGTAEYASERLGSFDYMKVSTNEGESSSWSSTGGGGGTSEGASSSKENEAALLPSEFMGLQPGSPERGIEGVFITRALYPWRGLVSPAFIRKWWEAQRPFEPQPVAPEYLEPLYKNVESSDSAKRAPITATVKPAAAPPPMPPEPQKRKFKRPSSGEEESQQ